MGTFTLPLNAGQTQQIAIPSNSIVPDQTTHAGRFSARFEMGPCPAG